MILKKFLLRFFSELFRILFVICLSFFLAVSFLYLNGKIETVKKNYSFKDSKSTLKKGEYNNER